MTLFYAAGTCSLAPHIVSLEVGMPLKLEKVDIRAKTYAGGDYKKINPKGSVPAIQLDDGQILTEGVVLMQYLADHKPDAGLIPRAGSLDRYRQLEWLNFITTEVHKRFSTLFNVGQMVTEPAGQEQLKTSVKNALGQKFEFISQRLGNQPFLMGEQFTAADAYLYTVLRWTKPMQIDLSKYPVVQAFFERVGARPKVQEAVAAEGQKA